MNQRLQQDQESEEIKKDRPRKTLDAEQMKNQRINRRMKKIINNANSFSNRQNQQKCAICLSQFERNSATLPCDHVFCIGCIANWWVTNSTCPYCRQAFNFIFDFKGRRLNQSELPSKLLIEREQFPKCQSCWADIGEEPMRICFQCRGVYVHKRCLTGEQIKIARWKCDECIDTEEQEFQKMLNKKQKRNERKGPSYKCSYRIDLKGSSRHSQRIISQRHDHSC